MSELETLHDRVSRLEDAVAMLQDTCRLEERVAERVASRLSWNAGPAGTDVTGIMASAARKLLPVARHLSRGGSDAFSDVPPHGAGMRQSWLLVDFCQELRAMVRMYFDRRFRVGWPARVVPIAACTLFLCSWFVIGGISFVGPLLDRLIEVLLICLVYKVLARDAQRYRSLLAGLPPGHTL